MSIKYYTDEQLAEQLAVIRDQLTEKDRIITDLNLKLQALENTIMSYREDKIKKPAVVDELDVLLNGK